MKKYQDENWLTEQYWGFNRSANKMGKECNCNARTIDRWMRKYNIPRRSQGKSGEIRMGEKSSRWKGGKMKQQGYIFIYSPDHPFKSNHNYVQEHRLIMEQYLRETDPDNIALIEIDGEKYLDKKWISHHKNEIKCDNRIENLKVMTNSDHVSFHNAGKKNSFYEKHHTEETKQKISEFAKNRTDLGRGFHGRFIKTEEEYFETCNSM